MTDEILSAQRPPEKEEAAPAPASALGTATTSEDVTNDITIPHGDAQPITETNTGLDYQLYPNTSHIHPHMCG